MYVDVWVCTCVCLQDDLDELWKERLQSERNAFMQEYHSYSEHAHCSNADEGEIRA